jgi:hypothetical protein
MAIFVPKFSPVMPIKNGMETVPIPPHPTINAKAVALDLN